MLTLAVLELNDSGIQWRHNEHHAVSPGYAIVTDSGIITGTPALRRAWLEPQCSFNHYWHQLNLTPLPLRTDFARHAADLAYAQLQQLHRDMGAPSEVIFTVPSNMSSDQLALLLGLVNAAGFQAAGVVDAAVAASVSSGQQGSLLYVDIQLHTVVITAIDATDSVARGAVESLPEIGLKVLHDHWAQWLANAFIRQYRYDPLHTAAGEQQLRDRLPGWLSMLVDEPEVAVELSAPQGNFRLNVLRSELVAVHAHRLARLTQAIARYPSATLLISQRVAALPGLAEYLPGATVVPYNGALHGCELSADALCRDQSDGLHFVTALPFVGAHSSPSPVPHARRVPTHLVYHHRAYPIGKGIGIRHGDTGLQFSDSDGAPTALQLQDDKLVMRSSDDGIRCRGARTDLQCGDQIEIGTHQIGLIEVL